MSVCIQLGQMAGDNVVEVSGIKEVCGVHLESSDVAIAVGCEEIAADKRIQLFFSPAGSKSFVPFSIAIPVLAQRIVLARLLDDGKVIIVSESIDEDLCDMQAATVYLQNNGGLWMDGLPRETIKEIIKYCSC